MTSRIETGLRVASVVAIAGLAIASFSRQAALARGHAANPATPADLAVLKANGDTVSGSAIRNACGGIVQPIIFHPAADIAIVTEIDPTGQCVGSNPPGSLAILLLAGTAWRPEAGFPASSYRLGPVHDGRPDIIGEYPPFNHDCPTLAWDSRHYRLVQACNDGRSP
jgi:hypothetical protein